METLGSRLRFARERAGLSIRDVAKALNLTHVSVGNWERDQTRPKLPNLIEAAVLLDVSIEWLTSGREQPAEPEPPKGTEQAEELNRPLLAAIIAAYHDILQSGEKPGSGEDMARGVLAIYDWALESPDIVPPELIDNPGYARSLIRLMLAGRK